MLRPRVKRLRQTTPGLFRDGIYCLTFRYDGVFNSRSSKYVGGQGSLAVTGSRDKTWHVDISYVLFLR